MKTIFNVFVLIATLMVIEGSSQAQDGPILAYQAAPYGTAGAVKHLWAAFCDNADCSSLQRKYLDGFAGDRLGDNANVLLVNGKPFFTHSAHASCTSSPPGLRIVACSDPTCSGSITRQTVVGGSSFYAYNKPVIGSNGRVMVFFIGGLMAGEFQKHKLGILRCGNDTCTSGNQTQFIDLSLDMGFIDAVVPPDGKPLILTSQNVDFVSNKLTTFKCSDANCSSVTQGFSLQAPSNYFYGKSSITVDENGRGRLFTNLRNNSSWTDIQHTLMTCTNANCASVVQKPITNIYSAGQSLVSQGVAGAPVMFNLNYLSSPNLYTFETRQCADNRRCAGLSTESSPTGLTGVTYWDAAVFQGNPGFALYNGTNSALYYKTCLDPLCSLTGPNVLIDQSTDTRPIFGSHLKLSQ